MEFERPLIMSQWHMPCSKCLVIKNIYFYKIISPHSHLSHMPTQAFMFRVVMMSVDGEESLQISLLGSQAEDWLSS